MSDTKIQWHPGFIAAMNLELKENKDDLIFEKEYNLNTKPLEADLLIIKKRPEGLFQRLAEKGVPITSPHKGIYYIQAGALFPTQILVAKELEKGEHIWLKSLSEKLQKEDLEELLKRVGGLTGEFDKEMADSVLRVSIDANRTLIRELMEDGSMYESLMELMEPQIQIREKKSWDEGQKQGQVQGRMQGQKITAIRMLKSGKYTLEEILDISGLSPDEIEALKER